MLLLVVGIKRLYSPGPGDQRESSQMAGAYFGFPVTLIEQELHVPTELRVHAPVFVCEFTNVHANGARVIGRREHRDYPLDDSTCLRPRAVKLANDGIAGGARVGMKGTRRYGRLECRQRDNRPRTTLGLRKLRNGTQSYYP